MGSVSKLNRSRIYAFDTEGAPPRLRSGDRRRAEGWVSAHR